MIRYNFGCGPKKINEYVNVDALYDADIKWDLTDLPYKFAKSDSADEIVSIEVVEHIDFKMILGVLREWYRILKPGGILHIQVPDCGKMMEYYVNKQVCECVPHKDDTGKFSADKNCQYCGGNAIVNPTRWLYAFTGAQKHPFDYHRNIFTVDIMRNVIEKCGFVNIKFSQDKNKIKVYATK